MRQTKMRKEKKESMGNKENKESKGTNGRPEIFKWPGLELEEQAAGTPEYPRTRKKQIDIINKESVIREEGYRGDEYEDDTDVDVDADIEVDFDNIKFDIIGADGPHTTIDFDKVTGDGMAQVTTNDFVVFNRIKSVIFGPGAEAANERGWLITDLKFNSTWTALYFITVVMPLNEIKILFNKTKRRNKE